MIFEINELIKSIIMQNEEIDKSEKEELCNKVKYNEVRSIEAVKIIDGALNYGTVLTEEVLSKLPKCDCTKLNTSLYLILKYYKQMDCETFFDSLDLMININVDSIKGGLVEEDKDAPITAVIDILEDYVFGSSPDDADINLSDDEIEIYKVNVDYGKVMIRQSKRDFLNIY